MPQAILIECKLRRPGGTKVTFPHPRFKDDRQRDKEYHFKPNGDLPNVPHVCSIDNDDHVQRLLAIEDGYRIYRNPNDRQDDDEDGEIEQPAGLQSDPKHADAAADAKVDAILALGVRELRATINTFSDGDLSAALEAEERSESPRTTFIQVLRAHLQPPAGEEAA